MDQNKSIELLTKYISKELAIIVEKSILNFSQDYAELNETPFLLESIYDTKVFEITSALSVAKEKKYVLIKNENDAAKITFYKPEELYPEKYEDLLKKKEIEEYKKNNVKSSSAFKCSKCKKNKCQVTQKQIRAGDEPATTFVTCLECGHVFSFN
jgi:DNA-directed RNA polymerase subunit M/transcription elongation factor TFIIS